MSVAELAEEMARCAREGALAPGQKHPSEQFRARADRADVEAAAASLLATSTEAKVIELAVLLASATDAALASLVLDRLERRGPPIPEAPGFDRPTLRRQLLAWAVGSAAVHESTMLSRLDALVRDERDPRLSLELSLARPPRAGWERDLTEQAAAYAAHDTAADPGLLAAAFARLRGSSNDAHILLLRRIPQDLRTRMLRAAPPTPAPEASGPPSWLNRALGHVYLLYLGLLPALASFGALYLHHRGELGILSFLGGVAAVGVYLGFVGSYTRLPRRAITTAWLLLDGPVFVIVGWLLGRTNPLDWATDAYLVDGSAIWIAIGWEVARSDRPTSEEGKAIMVIVAAALASTLWVLRGYIGDVLVPRPGRAATLALGIVMATVASRRTVKADLVLSDAERVAFRFLLPCFLLWLALAILGSVLGSMHAGR